MNNTSRLSCLHPPFVLSIMAAAVLMQSAMAADNSAQKNQQPLQVADAGQQVADVQMASQFNDNFLTVGRGQKVADLSLFAFGQRVLPGVYLADIYVNGTNVDSLKVRFDLPPGAAGEADKKSAAAKATAEPCLTRAMLSSWGVDLPKTTDVVIAPEDTCYNLTQLIPDSRVSFDMGKQQLDVSIPQIFMRRTPRGFVPKESWNDGVTAAILNYDIYASHRETGSSNGANSTSNNSMNAALRGGVNLGAWRLRQRSNYNRNDGTGKWQSLEMYVQRDIAPWNSRVTLGDVFTSAETLDSVGLRGVQISSDESMLPDSQRGFAPIVRGVAETRAKVVIRQNGYELKTIDVAPGPFIIDDLLPTSSSGELEITVIEADGRKKVTVQSFSAVPMQVREGMWRYQAAAGQYRSSYGQKKPFLAQGSLAYGLNSALSLYGGLQAANLYQAGLLGVGASLGNFGSVSFDASHARSKNPDGTTQQGQALSFKYAKSHLPSLTSFSLVGYRYSTQNYRTFSDIVALYDAPTTWSTQQYKRRHRVSADVSQGLGNGGAITVGVSVDSYWGGASSRSSRVSYGNTFKRASYQLFYSHDVNRFTYDSAGLAQVPTTARSLTFSVSLPLEWSRKADRRSTNLMYSATSNLDGRFTNNAMVSGSLLDDYSLSYSASMLHANDGSGVRSSAALTYRSPYATLGVSRDQGKSGSATTIGTIAGGLVLHSGGLTLAQSVGDTAILVSAPGAGGVAIENNSGVKTNGAGYAVVPNATPYRINNVALRVEDLPDSAEVKNAKLNVVPTKGALVLAQYETRQGYKAFLTLRDQAGNAVPFFSKVYDSRGREAGIVGARGRVYLTGLDAKGELNVVWGGRSGADGCLMKYELPIAAMPVDTSGKKGRAKTLTAQASCMQIAALEKP